MLDVEPTRLARGTVIYCWIKVEITMLEITENGPRCGQCGHNPFEMFTAHEYLGRVGIDIAAPPDYMKPLG